LHETVGVGLFCIFVLASLQRFKFALPHEFEQGFTSKLLLVGSGFASLICVGAGGDNQAAKHYSWSEKFHGFLARTTGF